MWQVYILECADGTFYAGVTNDLERRLKEHNSSLLGAKYTRARRPVKLAYAKRKRSRGGALKEEARIKGMERSKKIELIKAFAG